MRRTLALVLLIAAAVVGVPAPASAGGITSVLITDRSTGRATALVISDARFAALTELLDSGATSEKPPQSALGGQLYTVAWMAHDVHLTRIDFVHPGEDGTAYVGSLVTNQEGVLPQRPSWHLTLSPKVAEFFENLFKGVVPASTVAPEATTRTEFVEVPGSPETRTTWFSLEGWRWITPGLFAGLLAGLLTRRRRTADTVAPRQGLVDREHVGV